MHQIHGRSLLQDDTDISIHTNEIQDNSKYANSAIMKINKPEPQTSIVTSVQNFLKSPLVETILSNDTIKMVLSDPMVQGVLLNPVIQSVLKNPIVQNIMNHPELQEIGVIRSLIANIPQATVPKRIEVLPIKQIITTTSQPIVKSYLPPKPPSVFNMVLTGIGT